AAAPFKNFGLIIGSGGETPCGLAPSLHAASHTAVFTTSIMFIPPGFSIDPKPPLLQKKQIATA
ncbi:MAG: hypothetical protein Q4B68_02340, partial [Bacteroidales bacterium]|nr:hypothetical protein [Bacteroidales bacterium]